MGGGRFALAVGDTYVTHDPIAGQGANAASREAWALGELITAQARAGRPFDEAFCAAADRRLWEVTEAAAELSNALLQPPPPHALQLLVAAAQSRAVADAFMHGFDDPRTLRDAFKSPAGTAAFLRGVEARMAA